MEIPVDILEKCHSEGVAAYPEEACGFISGTSSDPDLLDAVWPMQNIMNDLHEKDPKPVSYTHLTLPTILRV